MSFVPFIEIHNLLKICKQNKTVILPGFMLFKTMRKTLFKEDPFLSKSLNSKAQWASKIEEPIFAQAPLTFLFLTQTIQFQELW